LIFQFCPNAGSRSNIDKNIKMGLIDKNAVFIFSKSKLITIMNNTIIPIKGRKFFINLKIFFDTVLM